MHVDGCCLEVPAGWGSCRTQRRTTHARSCRGMGAMHRATKEQGNSGQGRQCAADEVTSQNASAPGRRRTGRRRTSGCRPCCQSPPGKGPAGRCMHGWSHGLSGGAGGSQVAPALGVHCEQAAMLNSYEAAAQPLKCKMQLGPGCGLRWVHAQAGPARSCQVAPGPCRMHASINRLHRWPYRTHHVQRIADGQAEQAKGGCRAGCMCGRARH